MKKYKSELYILFGSFFTLLAFGFFAELFDQYFGTSFLVGAFGASTAILFSSFDEIVSRYKNMSLGYLISCIIGVWLNLLLGPNLISLKVACSVSIAIFLMRILKVFHPAGGAIALLAAVQPYSDISDLYLYLLGTSIIGPTLFYLIVLGIRQGKAQIGLK